MSFIFCHSVSVRNVDMSWPEELSQIARNHKQKSRGQESCSG